MTTKDTPVVPVLSEPEPGVTPPSYQEAMADALGELLDEYADEEEEKPAASAIDHEKLAHEKKNRVLNEGRTNSFSDEDMRRLVQHDTNSSDILRILMNGKQSLGTTHAFTLHDRYLQYMILAYEKKDGIGFLEAVRGYLKMAPRFTPQTGSEHLVEHRIDLLRGLMEMVGLVPVAQKLLGVIHAPANS